MSNFTPTKCYDLSKYQVNLNKTGILIIDTSNGKTVDDRKFSDGFEIMVHEGDFCFGTISFTDSFIKEINLKDAVSNIYFEESTLRVIGWDAVDDPGIAHLYGIDRCPIHMETDDDGVLQITCPCDTEGTPCSNRCYEYGARP